MRNILLVVLLLATSVFTFGQGAQNYGKYRNKHNYQLGYIETKSGTRTEGLIKDFTSELKAHAKIVFVTKGGSKMTYYPSAIKRYGSSYKEYVSNGRSFFEVTLSGKTITLYKLRYVSGGYGGNIPSAVSSAYYVKRPSENEFLEIRRMGFRRKFQKYFADCPDLQRKISSKELTHKDAKEIVRFYQQLCAR